MARKQVAARRHQSPYRDHHEQCQYSWALREFGVMHLPWELLDLPCPRQIPKAYELDHIYGKRGPCEDTVNYMMAHPVAHTWKTDNTKLGRITAMWCKIRLQKMGGSPFLHWDEDAVARIWGKRPLGMLSIWADEWDSDLPVWCQNMVLDIREMLGSMPTGE